MLIQNSLPTFWLSFNKARHDVSPVWLEIVNNKCLQGKFKSLHRSHRQSICRYIGGWKQSPATRLHHQLKVRMTGRMNAWSQANIKPKALGMADHAAFRHWRHDLKALVKLIENQGWQTVCEEQLRQKRQAKRLADEAEISWRQAGVIQWINGDRANARRDWHKYSGRLDAIEAQGEKLKLLARYYAPPLHLARSGAFSI